jgi:hypothetical protein
MIAVCCLVSRPYVHPIMTLLNLWHTAYCPSHLAVRVANPSPKSWILKGLRKCWKFLLILRGLIPKAEVTHFALTVLVVVSYI